MNPYWAKLLSIMPGKKWPDVFVAFDLETSGFGMDLDVITQFGHCLVENGKVVSSLGIVVNWLGRQVPPDSWLRDRLDRLQRSYEIQGKGGGMTVARMQQYGVPAEKALTYYYELFEKFKKAGILCVGHNALSFDERMLESNFAGFSIANDFNFGDNGLFDSDLVERARQIPDNHRVFPWRDDTLRSYFTRLKGIRLKGLYSNLGEHCRVKYAFDTHGITKEHMHDAESDSYCVYILMEAWRQQMADGSNTTTPTLQTPMVPTMTRFRGQRNN